MLTSEEKARLLELINHVELAEKCCDPEHAVYSEDGELDYNATCAPCPYKGGECDNSRTDPKRRDTLEVFRLARKAAEEEPARLLTVEEMRSLPVGAVVWEEDFNDNELESYISIDRDLEPLVRGRDGAFWGYGERYTEIIDDMHEGHGNTTRWWLGMPTKMQMITTPWEEKEEKHEAD